MVDVSSVVVPVVALDKNWMLVAWWKLTCRQYCWTRFHRSLLPVEPPPKTIKHPSAHCIMPSPYSSLVDTNKRTASIECTVSGFAVYRLHIICLKWGLSEMCTFHVASPQISVKIIVMTSKSSWVSISRRITILERHLIKQTFRSLWINGLRFACVIAFLLCVFV